MAEPVEIPVNRLLGFPGHTNIAEELTSHELARIGQRCVAEYEYDKGTMEEWQAQVDQGMKLAKQVLEHKNHPWPDASNIKLPLISSATLRFAGEAYSELVRGGEVVKTQHPGLPKDAQESGPVTPLHERSERVKKYMNYQLMTEMEEWEPETDKMLHILPIVGCLHKKTFYNPLIKRNETTLVPHNRLAIDMDAPDLARAPRVTEEFDLSSNELHERTKSGLWIDQTYDESDDGAETDKRYDFYEQHRWLDLDEDGYEEPYIVTFSKEGKVARVVARFEKNDILINTKGEVFRIEAIQHYTKYSFIPSLEGGYWDIGWAHMLAPLTAASNTLMNQLVDGGTLSNTQGGFFSKHVRLQEGGTLKIKQGEWKRVSAPGMKLADSFFPLPVREPSNVLFMLLGMTVEMAKELSSITEVMTGEQQNPNTPATTVLAMIEQGQKVFSSIHKRIYRGMRDEFRKLYRLNSIYIDPAHYQRVLNVQANHEQDFNQDDLDIIPTANPELSSKYQRRAQAQALISVSGRPGVDEQRLTAFYIEQIGVDNHEQFLLKPNPEQQKRQMRDMELDDFMKDVTAKQAAADLKKTETEIQKNRGDLVKTKVELGKVGADTEKVLAETDKVAAETVDIILDQ